MKDTAQPLQQLSKQYQTEVYLGLHKILISASANGDYSDVNVISQVLLDFEKPQNFEELLKETTSKREESPLKLSVAQKVIQEVTGLKVQYRGKVIFLSAEGRFNTGEVAFMRELIYACLSNKPEYEDYVISSELITHVKCTLADLCPEYLNLTRTNNNQVSRWRSLLTSTLLKLRKEGCVVKGGTSGLGNGYRLVSYKANGSDFSDKEQEQEQEDDLEDLDSITKVMLADEPANKENDPNQGYKKALDQAIEFKKKLYEEV